MFFFLVHRLLPTFLDLRLDFAAPTRRFSVLFLTFNMMVKRQSDFLALGFLTAVDVIVTLELSSVTSSGVDTISTSRISLRFFGHQITCMMIYIFCVIKNLCSIEDLLHNY